VSIVKINAITVPRERICEFERRFATRAGKLSDAWVASPDFAAGHAQHRQDEPVGTASELWSFDVLETEVPERA
jgi:heme-degrading monooxygenase HmoA